MIKKYKNILNPLWRIVMQVLTLILSPITQQIKTKPVFWMTVFVFAFAVNTKALISPSGIKVDSVGEQENIKGERLKVFNEAKFGMFIHWGPYAIYGGEYKDGKKNYAEWIQLQAKIPANEYEKVAAGFNPVKFNADEWVKLARDAGARYIVITTKHHDGFCMFDTEQTDYNIVDYTPFKRDPIMELAEACKKNNIKLGLYYSIVDWHHPEFPEKYAQHGGFHGRPNPNANIDKYADYEIAQVKELLSKYGDVFVIWFDGGGAFKGVDKYGLLKGDKMIDAIRTLQPNCLINNRIGKGDYGTPEQHIPGEIQDQAFEVCMTIGKHWGYNKFETKFKSTKDLIRKLVDVSHKGGNFLLNVGPRPDGVIPEIYQSRMHEMGRWLAVNGASVYGTKASPFEESPWGRTTCRILSEKSVRLYLHIFENPTEHTIVVPALTENTKAIKAWLLADKHKKRLKLTQKMKGGQITINLPKQLSDDIDTVVVLDIDNEKKQ